MRTDLDKAIAVAGRPSRTARLAFARKPHAHAIVDTGGDGHLQLNTL
jgi:hypothetical protein